MATRRKEEERAGSGSLATTQPSRSGMQGLQPFGFGPFSLLQRMFNDMERLTDLVSGGQQMSSGGGRQGALALWTPRIDVVRRDDRLVVRADLPGISPDEVSVELRNNALIIEGQRTEESEDDSGDVYRMERVSGAFRRIIELPQGIDPSATEARFENGVLEIKVQLPRDEQRGHRIQIQSQGGRQMGTGSTGTGSMGTGSSGASEGGQSGRGGAQASADAQQGGAGPVGAQAGADGGSPGRDDARR
jgi:HSP20 family protein